MLHGPVTFDSRSFSIGGQRIWIHSGEIHYFRHPSELWRETLLRARQGGMNAISTCIAWNYHEPVEGQCDFTGDRDVAHFLDLCAEIGLWVIARPGPYICAEWDAGGLPAWLLSKPGIRPRENDPTFVKYARGWFDRILPLLAKRQVSRGGSVILVQNENEYAGGWDESTRSYTRLINDSFRAAGLDIPIIACNAHSASPNTVYINYSHDVADQMIWPEVIVTYNSGPGVEPVRDLRRKQPNAPLFMTEFWSGPQSFWGRALNTFVTSPEYGRNLVEFASVGCQVTNYMFDGGTNFAHWGASRILTSYESNYPVREGGMLSEKYYRLKPLSEFITRFGSFLAESDEILGNPGYEVPAGTRLVVRQSQAGQILFFTDPGSRPTIPLKLPQGQTLEIHLPTVRGMMLPYQFTLPDKSILDYANICLLGYAAGSHQLLMWGVAGTMAVISVNGERTSVMISAAEVIQVRVGGTTLCVMDETMADRAWWLTDRMIFGADLAHDAEMKYSAGSPRLQELTADGHLIAHEIPVIPSLPTLPELLNWSASLSPEPSGSGDGWIELAGPCSHEKLGRHYGYVWYRAEFEAAEEGPRTLFIPQCNTRLTVYNNGCYAGTFGELCRSVDFGNYRHPNDWQQETVTIQAVKGRNLIVMLSDNNGRYMLGMPDEQGLQGPVYVDAVRLLPQDVRAFGPEPVLPAALAGAYGKTYRALTSLPGVAFNLSVPPDADTYVAIPCGVDTVVVTVDGQVAGAFSGGGYHVFRSVLLPPTTTGRSVSVRVQFKTAQVNANDIESIICTAVSRQNRLGHWAWKAGGDISDLSGGQGVNQSITASGPAHWGGLVPNEPRPLGAMHKAWPTFYSTTFPRPSGDMPLFVRVGSMQKGQLYLNGHNIGRFWQTGGFGNGVQVRYYLPKPWLKDQNTLVAFEEYGLPPNGAALVWGPSETIVSEPVVR